MNRTHPNKQSVNLILELILQQAVVITRLTTVSLFWLEYLDNSRTGCSQNSLRLSDSSSRPGQRRTSFHYSENSTGCRHQKRESSFTSVPWFSAAYMEWLLTISAQNLCLVSDADGRRHLWSAGITTTRVRWKRLSDTYGIGLPNCGSSSWNHLP